MPAVAARPALERRVALGSVLPLPLHPAFRRLPAPVIIIGTGRSGTSLASAMLARLGVFMGPELQQPQGIENIARDESLRSSGYGEAGEFFRLNELLLRSAGAAWDRPGPFLQVRDLSSTRTTNLGVLCLATYGRLRTRYLAAYATSGLEQWGWKDPRNSLTLPYWLQAFPEARVLHVRRGVDAVAESLYRRSRKWEEAAAAGPARGSGLRALARRVLGRRSIDPCLDRSYCRDLAEEYLRECLQYRVLGKRYLEVQYEEMLASPSAAVAQIARLTGVAASPQALENAAALVSWGGKGYTSENSLAETPSRCRYPEIPLAPTASPARTTV